MMIKTKNTLWPESISELYQPRDRRLSAKLVPTFTDRGCHVVSVTNTYGRILGFLDRARMIGYKNSINNFYEDVLEKTSA
jgi:CBS-domain-containing membrane protein